MKTIAVGMLLALVASVVACNDDSDATSQIKGKCDKNLKCAAGQQCIDLTRRGIDYDCVEGDPCTAAGCGPQSCDYLEINPPRIVCH